MKVILLMLITFQAHANCVSEMIYHEARSESFIGQVAVANVAYNRAAKSGKSVCKEIHKPKQFSFFNKGFVPKISDKNALSVAEKAAFLSELSHYRFYKMLVCAYVIIH